MFAFNLTFPIILLLASISFLVNDNLIFDKSQEGEMAIFNFLNQVYLQTTKTRQL